MNFKSNAGILAVVFVLIGLASCSASPPATGGQLTFQSPGKPVVIPFLFRNNHILVRGRVNDSDSLWFILDTGASNELLDQQTGQGLGLKPGEATHSHGAGGTVQGVSFTNVRFQFPGIELRAASVPAIPLESLARQTAHECNGIVGFGIFNGAVVEVDYGRSTLTLHEPSRFKYAGKGSTLPITLRENHPYVKARVTLPGGSPIEGQFVIDTGSVMALVFGEKFVKEHNVAASMARTLQVRLGGVGGPTICPQGRIARVEIGPYALDGPVAALRQGGVGHISHEGTAGNIGADILHHFTVTFDYARKQMILEPGLLFEEPFEADKSGLVLVVPDDSTAALRVLLVQPDSPAAEAGIAAGDLLVGIDGRSLGQGEIVTARKSFREDGRTFRLGLRRGATLSEVTLTTRRLI